MKEEIAPLWTSILKKKQIPIDHLPHDGGLILLDRCTHDGVLGNLLQSGRVQKFIVMPEFLRLMRGDQSLHA